ncbi:ubiquinone biosynthesis protein COQ9, mitochondrial-like isoform X2 [Penaeus chinensis]|uniref:ubiquinone biosynthesis protein COQ9, mitochondrial-like isoform X2 n=1 Tax=Penaeus chinensis TaxID=139456 RepID=UPI001FB80C4D|nr:ubiquinone biosynthesis protein COQ9, mitochondrial-like isoform X2 [Penaeus chinensis]
MISTRHLLIRVFSIARHSGYSRGLSTSASRWRKEETAQGEGASTGQDAFESESSSEEDYDAGEDQLRAEILNAAMPFIYSHGWSQEAIAQGAETLGYSGMAHGMFPKGGVELVNHFYATCNNKLEENLAAKAKEIENNPELKKGTTAFIAESVEDRLRMNIEYLDTWHQALALHASPTNMPEALDNLGRLVDHIWYYAGDRSHDFNWYTKRGILAAVYKSTELYMLQDKSEDFEDTWAFMNRRLSDVHSVAKCARNADNVTKDIRNVVKAGLLTALNIVGMNDRSR